MNCRTPLLLAFIWVFQAAPAQDTRSLPPTSASGANAPFSVVVSDSLTSFQTFPAPEPVPVRSFALADTLTQQTVLADSLPFFDPGPVRKGISTGLAAAIMLSMGIDAYYTWWKGAEKNFTFFNEGFWNNPHLGLDKFGHLYGTYAIFKGIHTLLRWGGHSENASMWWALGLGLFHAIEIEVGDGFSEYGFDPVDLAFDLAGLGYGFAQVNVPFLQNFDLKFSYWSGQGLKTPMAFTEDYDALTIWMAFNIHNLLPSGADRYWPKWLNIAAGYSTGGQRTYREFLFAFDINFKGFTSSDHDVIAAEKALDLMHFPMPGVSISPSRGPEYSLFLLK